MEVKIALISLAGVIITGMVSIITSYFQNRRTQSEITTKIEHHSEMQDARLDAKIEKYSATTDVKIDNLTAEVRKHNNFAERIPALEVEVKNLKAEVRHQ